MTSSVFDILAKIASNKRLKMDSRAEEALLSSGIVLVKSLPLAGNTRHPRESFSAGLEAGIPAEQARKLIRKCGILFVPLCQHNYDYKSAAPA